MGSLEPSCPICESHAVAARGARRDRRRGLVGEWHFWECGNCGAFFQHPMPGFAELQSYYKSYATDSDVTLALSRGTRHDRLRRWFHRFTGDVDPRDFVPATPGQRLLDYGCGAAPYLAYFHARGVQASGAEISSTIVGACRRAGLDVALIERSDQIPFPALEFDIVYTMQVIEHITRPHQFFGEIHRILRPGGALYLAMPNALSHWRRVFGPNWVTGWFAPFHVFVYSLSAVRILAQAHGFEVVRSWSATSDSWMRLNLRAVLDRANNRLDSGPRTWLDTVFMRALLTAALRLAELGVRERDCLVVELKRC